MIKVYSLFTFIAGEQDNQVPGINATNFRHETIRSEITV